MFIYLQHTVDGWEILHHVGWLKPHIIKNGINHIPQLVQDFFYPACRERQVYQQHLQQNGSFPTELLFLCLDPSNSDLLDLFGRSIGDIMGEWGNRSIIEYRLTVYWGSNGNRILRICCESRGDLLGIFHGHWGYRLRRLYVWVS